MFTLTEQTSTWERIQYYVVSIVLLLCIPLGEGVSGVLHWKDLVKIAAEVGFAPSIVVTNAMKPDPTIKYEVCLS